MVMVMQIVCQGQAAVILFDAFESILVRIPVDIRCSFRLMAATRAASWIHGLEQFYYH